MPITSMSGLESPTGAIPASARVLHGSRCVTFPECPHKVGHHQYPNFTSVPRCSETRWSCHSAHMQRNPMPSMRKNTSAIHSFRHSWTGVHNATHLHRCPWATIMPVLERSALDGCLWEHRETFLNLARQIHIELDWMCYCACTPVPMKNSGTCRNCASGNFKWRCEANAITPKTMRQP